MTATPHAHGVSRDQVEVLEDDAASDLAARFKLLSDPHRLKIVYALVEGGEMCVSDIAALVESTETACSHQLRNLRLAGFVRSRRSGPKGGNEGLGDRSGVARSVGSQSGDACQPPFTIGWSVRGAA